MKAIEWKVVLNDDDKIISLETAKGFNSEKLESHLTIIGILENLKQKHLDKMKTLYSKVNRSEEDESEL